MRYMFWLSLGVVLLLIVPMRAWASSDVVADPMYWSEDTAYDASIKENGTGATAREIARLLATGAEKLGGGAWLPTEDEAQALSQAIRWAVLADSDSALPALDALAIAPRGNVPANWHYALTYDSRWAAWLIRTRDQSAQQRVADLIAVWEDEAASLEERSFAEDRLVEEPAATPVLTDMVRQLYSRAGTVKDDVLYIEDPLAAVRLSRLETILAVKAQLSERKEK